jgi:hypothetical protein
LGGNQQTGNKIMSNKSLELLKEKLPTQTDPGVDVILRETARANPMLRFKEGEYLVGDEIIEMGREYLAYPLDWTRGWVKWEDGAIVQQRMVRVADDAKLPTREELGDDDESLWDEERTRGCFRTSCRWMTWKPAST